MERQPSLFDLSRPHNVLFVTLDSCGYECVLLASQSRVSRWGVYRRSQTPGAFTLPAHLAFFCGHLPHVVEHPHRAYYTPEVRQLWRLGSARSGTGRPVGLLLEGRDVIDGYRRLGYATIGAGGVGWFKSQLLQALFDEFFFLGPHNMDNLWRPRLANEFASLHAARLADVVRAHDRWFLFVNCAETHAPYDTGHGIPAELEALFKEFSSAWACKLSRAAELGLNEEILRPARMAQVRAFEELDRRLENLIDQLPSELPLLLVICGDHGEAFGRNGVWGHGLPTGEIVSVPLLIGWRE